MGITAKRKEADIQEIERGEPGPDVPDFFEAQQNLIEKTLKKHQPPQNPIESVE